jgi:hypothetical protein
MGLYVTIRDFVDLKTQEFNKYKTFSACAGGVHNTTAKQYGGTIYTFCEGMLVHHEVDHQLRVSLAFILFLFPLILITFCIIISKRSVWC